MINNINSYTHNYSKYQSYFQLNMMAYKNRHIPDDECMRKNKKNRKNNERLYPITC